MYRISIKRDASNFFISAAEGNTTALKVILKNTKFKNFWINEIEPASGLSALMLASYHGKFDAVKLLLENGADPNIKGNGECTALSLAQEKKHKKIYNLLERVVKAEDESEFW